MLHGALAVPASPPPVDVEIDVDAVAHWKQRLTLFSPAILSEAEVYKRVGKITSVGAPKNLFISFEDIADTLTEVFRNRDVRDILIALLAVYIYRTSGNSDVGLAVCGGGIADDGDRSGADVAAFLPFLVPIRSGATFAEVLNAVADERSRVSALGPLPMSALEDGTSAEEELAAWTAPLPLALVLAEEGQSIDGGTAEVELVVDVARRESKIEYNDGYADAFAEAFTAHLCCLANAIASQPDLPVLRYDYLTQVERHRILVEWNDTAVDYPYEGGLVAQFERQVAATPANIAVVFKGTHLTYAEFDARVNRLANHLRKSNVGPDSFVALCLERSIEMVVAIWAILKAGAAYVPLNVEDPPQRLASIIRNAGARIVLTEEKFAKKLPRLRTKLVLLSPETEAIAGERCERPDLEIKPDDLAYMIYTSGSTGEPKGVLIEHRAIANRIRWMQDEYKLTPDDRVIQKTPYTFDVSVWEFLWPLTVGAALVVAEPGGHVVPSYMARLIRQERVTCAHFVPSVLRLFLTCQGLEDLPLRMVFCSGEALNWELQEQFMARLDCNLHNLYGPTEAAVDVTFWNCNRHHHRGRVPIGKPIANIELYILDENLKPVPVGVPGELHIGGVGLARGYWQRPELTAERFINVPIESGRGGRLYKTGDMARYLPDGNIEYLGRNDHQVKINGIRIELSEIESVIRSHPAVEDAAVITLKNDHGAAQLSAYMVPRAHGNGKAAVDHLCEFLARRLPPHMIPRSMIFIPRIPLTVSGKVDRRALPGLEAAA